MRLFRPNDPGHKFGGLTQIIFYISFLIDFFLIDLLYIRLSRSCDPSRFLKYFLIDFFFNFIL